MSKLEINNISLNIGHAEILRGVSAHVAKGEMIGLIGPNGAGKSSLLKSILGLVETHDGSVVLDGVDIGAMKPSERAKKIAYAAQGAPVHWPLTVEHIVGLGRVPHLNPWQQLSIQDKAAIETAIALTDCTHLKDRTVTTLSGGERARVLLARVLATDTDYILADEPVASLDPSHQLEVMDILKTQSKLDKGVLVVLHDLNLALRYCDRLILIDKGNLIGQGAAADILSDKNLRDVFGVRAVRYSDNGEDFIIIRQLDKL